MVLDEGREEKRVSLTQDATYDRLKCDGNASTTRYTRTSHTERAPLKWYAPCTASVKEERCWSTQEK